jgi:hypothetical protein
VRHFVYHQAQHPILPAGFDLALVDDASQVAVPLEAPD